MCLLAAGASAQVVIRERVEVQPRVALGPSSSLQDAGGTALCGEPVVGTVRYEARGGPSQAIYVIDRDLSTSAFPGEIVVTTECGAGAGPLARGFQYGSTWENHHGDGIHRHGFGRVDTVTVFEIDLKPLDRIQSRIQIPAAGLDQGFGSAWIHYFGCANGGNCAEVSHEVKGGAFGIQRIVAGAATGTAPLQPDWPDVLVCGTTAPVAFVAVRPGPTEGWLDPESQASVRLNDEVDEPVAARAHLVLDGGTPTLDLDTDYASVRRGEVLLVAPP